MFSILNAVRSSRRTQIFLGVSAATIGYFSYDRMQASRILSTQKSISKHYGSLPIPLISKQQLLAATTSNVSTPSDIDVIRVKINSYEAKRMFRDYAVPLLTMAGIDYQVEMVGIDEPCSVTFTPPDSNNDRTRRDFYMELELVGKVGWIANLWSWLTKRKTQERLGGQVIDIIKRVNRKDNEPSSAPAVN